MTAWTRGLGITHEPHLDAPDRPACASRETAQRLGFDLAEPGESTCGRHGCQELRRQRRGHRPPVTLADMLGRMREFEAKCDHLAHENQRLHAELEAAYAKLARKRGVA